MTIQINFNWNIYLLWRTCVYTHSESYYVWKYIWKYLHYDYFFSASIYLLKMNNTFERYFSFSKQEYYALLLTKCKQQGLHLICPQRVNGCSDVKSCRWEEQKNTQFHTTCSDGFPKTSQLTRTCNLLHVILQHHEFLSLVTVSKAATIHWKVPLDSFILHCAPPIAMICTDQLEHMEDPATRGSGMPAAAQWREKGSKRKYFSTWVGGSGATECSEMPGADGNDRLFSWFSFFFLASLKSSFTELHAYPRPQLFPRELPLHPARATAFWLCCCCMGDVSESSLENIPVAFPPPICSKPFKRIKSPSALQPENQHHSFQHNVLPCGLGWVEKREENPIWEST